MDVWGGREGHNDMANKDFEDREGPYSQLVDIFFINIHYEEKRSVTPNLCLFLQNISTCENVFFEKCMFTELPYWDKPGVWEWFQFHDDLTKLSLVPVT